MVVPGTIAASNGPASAAAAARRWLSSAKLSSVCRSNPYLSAIICAPANWLNSSTPYRSLMRSANGLPNPACVARVVGENIGTRVMLSTPAASTTSWVPDIRSEEHTSELQSLMRISYAVFCLNKQNQDVNNN